MMAYTQRERGVRMNPQHNMFFAQDEKWRGCDQCGWVGINCDCPHHPLPEPEPTPVHTHAIIHWPTLLLSILFGTIVWAIVFHYAIRAMRGM